MPQALMTDRHAGIPTSPNWRPRYWIIIMIMLIPAVVQAGSAEAWKDYQAEKNLMSQILTIGGIVVVGVALLWLVSKLQGVIDKRGQKSKSKKMP